MSETVDHTWERDWALRGACSQGNPDDLGAPWW